MRFENEVTKEVDTKIASMQQTIARLTEIRKEERQKLKDAYTAGWFKFVVESEYYGSHSEYGGGDVTTEYWFAPHVDVSVLEKEFDFRHGHSGKSEDLEFFTEWLETLEEDVDYIEE